MSIEFIKNTFNQELQSIDNYFEQPSSRISKVAVYILAFFATLWALITAPFKTCYAASFPQSTDDLAPILQNETSSSTAPNAQIFIPNNPFAATSTQTKSTYDPGDSYLLSLTTAFTVTPSQQPASQTDPLVLAAQYLTNGRMPTGIYN